MDLETSPKVGNDATLKFQYREPTLIDNTSKSRSKVKKVEELTDAYCGALCQLIACVTPEPKEKQCLKSKIFIKSDTEHWRIKSGLKDMTRDFDESVKVISELKVIYNRLQIEEDKIPQRRRFIINPRVNIKYLEGAEKAELGSSVYDIIDLINEKMVNFVAFVRNVTNMDVKEDMMLFNWASLKVDTDIETFTKDLIMALDFLLTLDTYTKDIAKNRYAIFEKDTYEIKQMAKYKPPRSLTSK